MEGTCTPVGAARPAARSSWAALLLATLLVGCRPPQAAVEANQLLDRGDLEGAQKKVAQGLASHPDEPTLRELDIQLHLARGDRPGAVGSYRAWLKQRGRDNRMLRHLALSLLRWGLKHRDPAIRLAALHGARKTDSDDLERGVAARLTDPDEVVRAWAAVALSGTPRGADTLEKQLRSSVARAREVAVANLGRIAGKTALTTLANFLEDPSPDVRAALARGLGSVKDPKVLRLLGRLAKDDSRKVRADTAAAVGKLGMPGGVAIVEGLLDDSYLGTRLAAVLALADLQGGAATSTLSRIAGGGDLMAALRAGLRLAKLGQDQPVLNAIAKGLVDRKWTIRSAACNTAAGLKQNRVALDLVRKAMRDPDPRVRMAAARAVLALGDTEGATLTARLVKNLACKSRKPEMEDACLEAAELMVRTGDRSKLAVIERLSHKAQAAQTRRAALRSALSAGALLGVAVEVLADADPKVALEAAVCIFRRLGD